MQQDNINKNSLTVEKSVKAAWSKPEIEVIDLVATEGLKGTAPNEMSFSAAS
ncbi:hypothetical protein Q4Q52_21040 [Shewanella sp. SP1S2-4]|uniref:hypothetical protein n=1 Tax=Shewanella sp. SP1S2-4 TaxID=3063537 RepID=UPI0028927C99|nr:hypothetical protein [Shewanella sp. SP1S2-4]MDT3322215.1 hypothetical protein [Shewanella sp. SP1S2-4]